MTPELLVSLKLLVAIRARVVQKAANIGGCVRNHLPAETTLVFVVGHERRRLIVGGLG
jgi:hypothetical protein